MITVSDEWKKTHQRPLLPESFVEITLGIESIYKVWVTDLSSCGNANFSQTTKIAHTRDLLSPKYYVTLEENLWSLDGSRQILPKADPGDNTGWVSYDNSIFEDIEYSGIQLKSQITDSITTENELGLDITWSSEYGEYPINFRVEAWQENTLVGTKFVTGNDSIHSHVDYDFVGYNMLRIIPTDWSMPNRRFRIDRIYFGRVLTFDKNQILNYSHEQAGDALGGELSKNAITFSLDNHDGTWDLLNPESITKHLSEQQEITVRYGLQTGYVIEWITGGYFYLSEWRIRDNNTVFEITATDAIGVMTEVQEYGWGTAVSVTYVRPDVEMGTFGPAQMYPTWPDQPYVFTSLEALYRAKASGVRPSPESGDFIYETESNWGHTTLVTGFGEYIPETVINGVSSILVYTMQGLSVESYYVDADLIKLKNDGTVYSYLGGRRSPAQYFNAAEITKSRLMTIRKSQKTHGELTQIASNLCACATSQRADGAIYTRPYWDYVTNYVIPLDFSYSEPELELSKPLKKIVVYYSFELGIDPYVYELNVGDTGETIVINNPTVNRLAWAEYLAEQYAKFYKERTWVSGEFRADPRLELFDIVQVEGIGWVLITQLKYSYTGSFHCTYKGKLLSDELLTSVAASSEVT